MNVRAALADLISTVQTRVRTALTRMQHGVSSSWSYWPGVSQLRGARADQSSIVIACVRWIQRNATDAPVVLQQWDRTQQGWITHAEMWPGSVLWLLTRPNGYYSGITLLKAIIADRILNGISYVIKVRSTMGNVVELWWAPAATIQPVSEGADFITYYRYTPNGAEPLELRFEDVIRLPDGMDPNDPRLGNAPVQCLLRECLTDEEAAAMTVQLMTNMGIPGVILSPKQGSIPAGVGQQIKRDFVEKTSGEKRGEPLVLEGQIQVDQFGFSPQELDMRSLRGIPEERITAVLGVNAAVVGLGVGLTSTHVGAPQPLSATLWTAKGPITMGEVEIGETIATPGGWAPVRAIYPQGEQDIYRVTFQDGSTAESTGDHLWQVGIPNRQAHPVDAVLPLATLAEFPYHKLRRTTVPLQGVTEFDEQPLVIPPYLLGLLLGDGTFRYQLCLSNTASEIVEAARAALPPGYKLHHLHDGDYSITYDDHARGRGIGGGSGNIHPIKDELRRLGLWMLYSHEKFIPDLYKYNSSEVRREVLRGLLDTDGYVSLRGHPMLEQTSARLADDVTFLVQSLGGFTLTHRKRANRETRLINGRPFASRYDRYSQTIAIDDPASLFRYSAKRDRCVPRVQATTRKFRAIELVRREEAQCISVGGEGLYLTDNFIVTHNTLKEYREEAFESTIIPLYRELGTELTNQLLGDFLDLVQWRVWFDLSQVRVLQEDENAKSERIIAQWRAGVISRSQAKRELGYPILPEDEVYVLSRSLQVVPVGTPPEEQQQATTQVARPVGRPPGSQLEQQIRALLAQVEVPTS